MSINVPGTEGYVDTAQTLINQWQSIPFAEHHRPVLHLLPRRPFRILDLGSGIGSDAAELAAMGHSVVAVEPVDELRVAANNLHPLSNVEWLDDNLPALAVVLSRRKNFDVVMMTAVWMHLDEAQRFLAMPVVSSILYNGGVLIMSLRHGPIPSSRRMFEVSSKETIQLASNHGLRLVFQVQTESVQQINRNTRVNWTSLAFKKYC